MSHNPLSELSPEYAKRAGRYLCFVVSECNRYCFFIAQTAEQAAAFLRGLDAYYQGLDQHYEINLSAGVWPNDRSVSGPYTDLDPEEHVPLATKLLSLGWITQEEAEELAASPLHKQI